MYKKGGDTQGKESVFYETSGFGKGEREGKGKREGNATRQLGLKRAEPRIRY